MDNVSKETRSRIMRAIKSSNTSIENTVYGMLRRKHGLTLHFLGADFVYAHRKVAIRVNGCFFHYCPAHGTLPKTRRSFWRRKFMSNISRDARVAADLRARGFRVIDIWEHDIRHRPQAVQNRLRRHGL